MALSDHRADHEISAGPPSQLEDSALALFVLAACGHGSSAESAVLVAQAAQAVPALLAEVVAQSALTMPAKAVP